MTAESGEGTVWLGGQHDGQFGKALKFSMVSTGAGGIRTPNFEFPTSTITVSQWFTPTRMVGASSIGRSFFKAYYPNAWSAPHVGFELAYANSVSGFVITIKSGSDHLQHIWNQDRNGLPQWSKHHVGFTFGDGYFRSYLNGELYQTTINSNALDLGTGPYCIGRTVSSSSNEHCGMILHEVRVDQVVRDANWFKQIYNLGK